MTARTDAERAAHYGRLLALIAEVADAVSRDRSMRLTGVQDLLHAHGIHGGQTDEDGQPVLPPHDGNCYRCAPLLAAMEDAGGGR